MHRGVVLLPILLLFCCRHCLKCDGLDARRSVARFTDPSPPPVDVGRYPGPLKMLPADHALAVEAAPLRSDIEANENILRKLVRDRIPVKSPLEFRFMYVGHDSAKSRLVLRYFSRAAVQEELAGWQVQLVYSLPALLPLGAYVQALPLE